MTLTCNSPYGKYGLVWRKDGGRLPSTASQSGGVLRIERVTARDAGLYICSDSGGRINDYRTNVVVQEGNQVASGGQIEDTFANVGGSLTLTCTAPYPSNMIWRKEGGRLPSNSFQNDGVLVISRVSASDGGVYICTASDGGGRLSEYRATVVIQGIILGIAS